MRLATEIIMEWSQVSHFSSATTHTSASLPDSGDPGGGAMTTEELQVGGQYNIKMMDWKIDVVTKSRKRKAHAWLWWWWENFNVMRSHFYDERLFLGFCVLLLCICLPADLCCDSQRSCDLVSDVCSPTLMKYWYSCCLELEQGFTSAFTKKYTIKTLYYMGT